MCCTYNISAKPPTNLSGIITFIFQTSESRLRNEVKYPRSQSGKWEKQSVTYSTHQNCSFPTEYSTFSPASIKGVFYPCARLHLPVFFLAHTCLFDSIGFQPTITHED